MNIGVDIRSLLAMSRGGIPYYTYAILRELVRQYPDDHWTLLQTGRHPYRLPSELDRPNVRLHHLQRPNRLINAEIAISGRPRLDQTVGGVDVWFAPGFGFLSLTPKVPLVQTVHDLSFQSHPEWYGWRSRAWHRAVRPRAAARRATRLIAVSKQTERELVNEYGIPDERITVIHPGVDDVYRQPVSAAVHRRVSEKVRLPKSYFLYVGALEPRKNPKLLLEAYRIARRAGLGSELVIAGRTTDSRHGSGRLLKDVHRLGFVDDADMPALYAEARALVLVSRYEGFGFPPLEALAAGTPSVVADLPIFRETVGPGAVRIGSDDPAALADSLVQLDGDTRLRKRLVAAGAKRLPSFTWERAARETRRVLTEAANAK